MAAILSVTVNKTDKNDARGIADAMRCNHYKEVNIRNSHDDAIVILLKSRATLVNNRRLLKNTVRGHLKNYGIRLGTVSHKQFSVTVRSYYTKLLQEAVQGIRRTRATSAPTDREAATAGKERSLAGLRAPIGRL